MCRVKDVWGCLRFGGGRLGQYGPVEVGDMLKPSCPSHSSAPLIEGSEKWLPEYVFKTNCQHSWGQAAQSCSESRGMRPWQTCEVEVWPWPTFTLDTGNDRTHGAGTWWHSGSELQRSYWYSCLDHLEINVYLSIFVFRNGTTESQISQIKMLIIYCNKFNHLFVYVSPQHKVVWQKS